MAVNKLKKGITMMMILVIMLVLTQVCDATQSLDIGTEESTDQYCHECKMKCKDHCEFFICYNHCRWINCRCCVNEDCP